MPKLTRLIALLLALLLLPSCAADHATDAPPENLRICFDLATNGNSFVTRIAVQKSLFQKGYLVDSSGGNFNDELEFNGIQPEYIPFDKNDPQLRLDCLKQVRDEIAAGNGPDIFVCACFNAPDDIVEGGRLFPDVKQAMEDDVFLPLDEYMDTLEMEECCQQVMNGGRNSAGEQVVLPISFSVPVVLSADGDSVEVLPDMQAICKDSSSNDYKEFVSGHPDYTMEPRLDEDGNVTAEVAMYCAVSKDCKRIPEALEIVKSLAWKYNQATEMNTLGCPEEGRMLTYTESMAPSADHIWRYRFINEGDYEKWKTVCAQITAVEFPADQG